MSTQSWIEKVLGIEVKTKEEIVEEQKSSTITHSLLLRKQLNKDIDKYKEKFRVGAILTNSYLYQMKQKFGHTNIDKLTLQELCMLGFTSKYIQRINLTEK